MSNRTCDCNTSNKQQTIIDSESIYEHLAIISNTFTNMLKIVVTNQSHPYNDR